MWRTISALAAALFIAGFGHSQTQPPIEAYGELPEIRYAALSDNGRKIALAKNQDGESLVVIYDMDGAPPVGVDVTNIQVRGLDFVGDEHVIIRASKATRTHGYRGRYEYSAAFAFSLENKKIRQLLRGTKGLYPAQSGLGQIVGKSVKDREVFMPAWMGATTAEKDLLRVDLERGRGRGFRRGNPNTLDWLVTPNGTVLAREDYSNKQDRYEIYTYVSGKSRLIYEMKDVARPPFALYGVKPGNDALIIVNRGKAGGFDQLREMDLDGNISAPIMNRETADIDWVITDINRVVHGVQYSGAYPTYEFFDPQLDKDVADLLAATPSAVIQIVDWSDDWQQILLRVESDQTSGRYIHHDRRTKKSVMVGKTRPDIPPEAVSPVVSIEYPARDGLTIPAIVTLPPGKDVATLTQLPLVVIPHGGPEVYDAAGFDWMAQYFANRGYLVLQPNFRGSAGYGADFVRAGNGEWGGKMQDDITDGVKALIADQLADPNRICIVGASYGGYAALAGGAFTPDLYNCVVAIAPVASLSRMLSDEKRDHGRDHWAINYWEERMADGKADRDFLKAISPVNHASAFQAPVLLIHGRDDTVVPISQSELMQSALKRADKPVEFIKLKGEDHWLSDGDTRLQTLQAVSRFVDAHIGQ